MKNVKPFKLNSQPWIISKNFSNIFPQDEILDSDFKKKRGDSSEERKRPGRRPLPPEDLAKKRAQALYRLLMEYQVQWNL